MHINFTEKYFLTFSKRNVILYRIQSYVIPLCLLTTLSTLMSSCILINLAIGDIETDISNYPEFSHILQRDFEIKTDMFTYQYYEDRDTNLLLIAAPGVNSALPKSIAEYQADPSQWVIVKGIVPAGNKFTVEKIVQILNPDGIAYRTAYINLWEYDCRNYRIRDYDFFDLDVKVGKINDKYIQYAD